MQAVKKLRTFAVNPTIKEAIVVAIGSVVGYKLVFTCFGLLGITFSVLLNTALGRPTDMWQRSFTEIICVLGLLIAVFGITIVLVATVRDCIVAFKGKK